MPELSATVFDAKKKDSYIVELTDNVRLIITHLKLSESVVLDIVAPHAENSHGRPLEYFIAENEETVHSIMVFLEDQDEVAK